MINGLHSSFMHSGRVHYYLFLLFFMLLISSFSKVYLQTNKNFNLHLTIEDEFCRPVPFASVTLEGHNQQKKAGMADSNGTIHLEGNEVFFGGKRVCITVSHIGYKTYCTELVDMSSEIYMTMNIRSSIISLKTCEVNGIRIPIRKGVCTGGECYWRKCRWDEEKIDSAQTLFETGIPRSFSFNVYPVPTNGLCTIESNNDTPFSVDIFDNTGKSLVSFTEIGRRKEIDLSVFAAGIYYARITELGKVVETKKIILSQ